MRIVPVLAAATLVAGSVAAATAPASAALTTVCNGTAEGVTVPGNLVVPAGRACVLTDVDVAGTTVVRRGADLVVTGGTFAGRVTLRHDALLDATDAMIEGRVQNGGFGLFAQGGHFGSDVVTRPADDVVPFTFTLDTHHVGGVDSVGAETLLESSDIEGDVSGVDGAYTGVFDSTIAGSITVIGNELGAVFCESEVDGDAVFAGNGSGIQLGATGALADCAGPSVWGGDVAIDDHTGGVELSGNIVRGDLSGEGNDPAPVGADNRVRGTVSGQFAELAPPADGLPQARRSMTAATAPQAPARKAEVAAEAEQRRAAATAEASAIGKAF